MNTLKPRHILALLGGLAVSALIMAAAGKGCQTRPAPHLPLIRIASVVDASADAFVDAGPRPDWTNRWFLDLTDPTHVGALPAMCRLFDAKFLARYYGDGTLAHTKPVPHPTQSGRWMLCLDGLARLELIALRSRCATAIDAGVMADGGPVPPVCTTVVGMPAVVTSLDSTWFPVLDGSDRPWDAGPNLQPIDGDGGEMPQ